MNLYFYYYKIPIGIKKKSLKTKLNKKLKIKTKIKNKNLNRILNNSNGSGYNGDKLQNISKLNKKNRIKMQTGQSKIKRVNEMNGKNIINGNESDMLKNQPNSTLNGFKPLIEKSENNRSSTIVKLKSPKAKRSRDSSTDSNLNGLNNLRKKQQVSKQVV